MFGKPLTKASKLPQLLAHPVALTPTETRGVSGGGANVLHGNGGGTNPNMYGPPGGNPADPNPVGPHDE
jgi:hypothetical protein